MSQSDELIFFRGWLNHQLVLNNIIYLYNHMYIHIQSVWGFGWYKKWKKTWIKTLHWGWTVLWVTHASIEPSRCYPYVSWLTFSPAQCSCTMQVPGVTCISSNSTWDLGGLTLQFPATSGSLKHSTGTLEICSIWNCRKFHTSCLSLFGVPTLRTSWINFDSARHPSHS